MSKRALILIPCSGRKEFGGIREYNRSNSIINFLSTAASKRLMELRKTAAVSLKEEPGIDLGFEDREIKVCYMEGL